MEVFFNISEFDKIDSILDFHSVIQSVKSDSSLHRPYNYSLYPIEHFYATNNAHPTKFIELRHDNVFVIESYFVQLSMKFKTTIPDVLHQNEKKNGENIPQPLVLTPPTQQEYEDIMNILLLGETGV
ncbi:unnamed protein product, partial [Rotaria magnacalcarata]